MLTTLYCWTTLAIAQVKKADPNTPLPVVSNEVFLAIAQFYEYDRNMPLDTKTISIAKYHDTNKEKIVFNGANNNPVPSYLVIPKNTEKVHPVVLLLDGGYGSKDRMFQDDGWPLGGLVIKALLEKGFAVMTCDFVGHGERSYQYGFAINNFGLQYPYLMNQLLIQTAIDHRRAIDYLFTRPEIDTTRIGIMGLSSPGAITLALTSIDRRIKSAIVGIIPISILKEKQFQPWIPSTFASRVKCSSILMFMGNKDFAYTMKEARQVFDMIPIKNKVFVEYNTGHEPPKEYVGMTADWFVKSLKP